MPLSTVKTIALAYGFLNIESSCFDSSKPAPKPVNQTSPEAFKKSSDLAI
ncbi:hypothetical protein CCACVL1_05632 [Corchorus capsularis]|uniref:Uncharacterized protein n=1 Tax=Corchorus capsularis TaxID=210143 RepID=A0A1R3JJK9_COCAP|nr:hypothetical protein CCACVL1_05632 [Corchorus capsularis]